MIELRARAEAADEALVARDLAPVVADRDLARADPRPDLQAGERDRDRVAVLAHGDERLLIDARRRGLARVERLAGQLAQQRPLLGPRRADRQRPPDDPPTEV